MGKPLPTRWIWIILSVVLFCFLLVTVPVIGPVLEALLTLVFGSGWFIARVMPQIHVRWDLVISALVYVVALVVGSHFFLRWLYREMNKADKSDDSPPSRDFGFAMTLRTFFIMLLMLLVGMAAIGVAHQTAWLVTSPEPLFVRRYYLVGRERCSANLTQILTAMITYANAHNGRYPDDFRQLISETQYPPEILICPASNDFLAEAHTTEEVLKSLAEPHHCSYLYFGKGLTTAAPPQTVLVTEPLENHRRGINVLYADKSVQWLDADEAEALLARLQKAAAATQPETRP